jgi:hypothetical protein
MSQAEGVALDRWRVDGGAGDAELVSNLLDGVLPLAVLAPLVVHLPGKLYLPRPEFGFLSAGAAAGAGGVQAVDGAFGHQDVLKLGDGAEDVEEHAAHGGGGVDALVEHHQVHALGLQLLGQLDQVFQRAAEPVEFGDHELAPCRLADRGPCPVRGGATGLVDEYLGAAGHRERVVLGLGVLVASGYPPVADPHAPDCIANP